MMPTLIQWLMYAAPGRIIGREMGGFLVALNIEIFISPLLAVPVLLAAGSYSGMFLLFAAPAAVPGLLCLAFYLKSGESSFTEIFPLKNKICFF